MFLWMMIGSIFSVVAGFLMYWKNPSLGEQNQVDESIRVSLVIPARNEENNLPVLLESACKQEFSFHEIIVVDDGSDDHTVEVAQKYGARVVSVIKDGEWTGKTAASWQGANAATGDLLVFIDADAWFAHPNVLLQLVSAYQEQGDSGILSIQPYHVIKDLYENFSAIFNIITMVGMNAFSVLGDKLPKAGVFGPFLLCQKEEYIQIGGQKAVKDALIEGFALGNIYKEKGLPIRLYGGKNNIHFRMYPQGVSQMIKGWSKHFATGSQSTHLFIWLLIGIWISGGFLTPDFVRVTLVGNYFSWMVIAIICYLLYFLQITVLARRTGNFSLLFTFFYPILFLFFLFVFTRSWIATHIFHTVTWKGRKIKL